MVIKSVHRLRSFCLSYQDCSNFSLFILLISMGIVVQHARQTLSGRNQCWSSLELLKVLRPHLLSIPLCRLRSDRVFHSPLLLFRKSALILAVHHFPASDLPPVRFSSRRFDSGDKAAPINDLD